eukprot:2618309-Pleurochrysis_carterae.AAC.1
MVLDLVVVVKVNVGGRARDDAKRGQPLRRVGNRPGHLAVRVDDVHEVVHDRVVRAEAGGRSLLAAV